MDLEDSKLCFRPTLKICWHWFCCGDCYSGYNTNTNRLKHLCNLYCTNCFNDHQANHPRSAAPVPDQFFVAWQQKLRERVAVSSFMLANANAAPDSIYRRVAWETCQVWNTTARSALCCLVSANGCHPGWQPQQLQQSLGCHRCSWGTYPDKPVFLKRKRLQKLGKNLEVGVASKSYPSLQQREGIVRVEILQKRASVTSI